MIIYGSSMSPFVRKVAALANEKGLAFELKAMAIGDPDPAFRAVSPFAKMPAMDDDGFGLSDSSAICHYLEAKHPLPPLIPADPRLRGRTIWFDEFADTLLFAAIAPMFFNRIVAPRFLRREGDLAAADKAERETLPPVLDYLETQIPDDDFLVGGQLTLADLAVASPFANLAHCEVAVDPAKYPRIIRYTQKMLTRSSLSAMVERERAFLART